MAYHIRFSDYPGTDTGPPDPERWIGPPGPQGIPGPQGEPGIPGDEVSGGPFLPLAGGIVSGTTSLGADQPTYTQLAGGSSFPTISAVSATANTSIVLTGKGTGTVTIGGPEASGNKGGLAIWSGPLQYPAFLTASGLSGVANSTSWGNTTLGGSITDSAAGYSMVNLRQVTDQLSVVNNRNVAYNNYTVRTTAQTTGSRWNGVFTLLQNAASGNNAIGRDFGMVGLQSYTLAGFNEGGTNTTTATKGSAWSFLTDAELRAGATNWQQLVGYELDISIAAGASASKKVGMQIVQLSTDKTQGANMDVALALANQIGGVGWRNGLTFGSYFAQWPIDAAGSLINANIGSNNVTVASAAAWGIDFNQVNFSGGFLRGPGGFTVDGSARIQTGTLVIAPNGATTTIDSNGRVGTGTPTIVSGGSGITVGMTYFDDYGGIYTTSAQSGGVATAFGAPYRQPTVRGAAPSNPITLSPSGLARQSGASVITVNLAWTAGASLSIQPTAGGMLGFNGATPITKPTGVAVTIAAVHTALTNLGLIAP